MQGPEQQQQQQQQQRTDKPAAMRCQIQTRLRQLSLVCLAVDIATMMLLTFSQPVRATCRQLTFPAGVHSPVAWDNSSFSMQLGRKGDS